MATTRNYLDFVCTQLEEIWGIDYKRMFGEYQIYVNDKPVRARSRRKFWTWKTAR